MGRTGTIFVAICMSIIACSSAAILVFNFGRPVGEAVSLSLALMCTMVVFHLLISRSRDKGAVSDAVDRLEERMADIDEDVGNLEGRMSGMETSLPRRVRSEVDPIFTEVEVLGTLIKQMAEAMSDLETKVEDQKTIAPPPPVRGLPYPDPGAYPQRERGYVPALDPTLPFGVRNLPGQNGYGGGYTGQGAHESELPQSRNYHSADRDRAARYEHDEDQWAPQEQRHRVPQRPDGQSGHVSRRQEERSAEPRQTNTFDPNPEPSFEPVLEPTTEPAVETKPDPAMRELITSALNANRVELHLQPIVNLPQRQVKYYEAFTRLRSAAGEMVPAEKFIPEAVRSGQIARIDNLLLFRSVQVIRRLTSRNRNAILFCNISSVSLADETFFPGFLEFVKTNESFSDVLVFEFSQDDVAAMGAVEMESLAALYEVGFRFSVDQIDDLKMDFRQLAQTGFRYAKLKADYLIGRREARSGHIHPSDFGDLLNRYGMELITDHVEAESQVLELLDFDVKLAQGNLFSPPRPVRSEVLQGTPAPGVRQKAMG